MNRQYIQIEIGILARVCSQNARGSGHYTPTPPLGASNGMNTVVCQHSQTVSLPAQCLSKQRHGTYSVNVQRCYTIVSSAASSAVLPAQCPVQCDCNYSVQCNFIPTSRRGLPSASRRAYTRRFQPLLLEWPETEMLSLPTGNWETASLPATVLIRQLLQAPLRVDCRT